VKAFNREAWKLPYVGDRADALARRVTSE
jgi:uncharacterized membrane protein